MEFRFCSKAIVSLAMAASFFAQPAPAQEDSGPALDAQSINSANLDELVNRSSSANVGSPDPALAKLQILLDRKGFSPGVIDGLDGENVHKAVRAFEAKLGTQVDGTIDGDLIKQLQSSAPAIESYNIKAEDLKDVTGPVPTDYSEKAKEKELGYETNAEAIAEKFHMDIDFLRSLNPNATFEPGATISVADVGSNLDDSVAQIEVDKAERQVRAYDRKGDLVAAYPATVGSEGNPSPSGTHEVLAVALMPTYTYDPKENFQQGDNSKKLEIPPGPNGPVGSVWIDLSEPTYGIHGSPDPALIDKVASHGCVRLTNWDAEELGAMVERGVKVDFLN